MRVLDLSGVRSTSLFGKILRLPLRLIPGGMVVRVLQGPQRGTRWIARATDHGAWLGTYEARKQERIVSSLGRGMTVWDVGANVGVYTLLAARYVGPTGRVTAFEPFPENVALLRRHIELNGHRQVTVVDKAVAGTDGEASFFPADSREQGRLGQGSGGMAVEVLSLDTYWRSSGECPDVVKMDIEGAEYDALSGAAMCLTKCRPRIFLATHGEEVHSRCLALLQQYGYDVSPLEATEDIRQAREVVATPRLS